jgi:hypothetical protein
MYSVRYHTQEAKFSTQKALLTLCLTTTLQAFCTKILEPQVFVEAGK